MKKYTLEDLARVLQGKVVGQCEEEISCEVTSDSNQKTEQGVFVAIAGTRVDGHDFLDNAFINGSVVAVVEKEEVLAGRAGIVVANSRKAYSRLCALFADDPTKKMQVVGVTGTNGKTTIHWLIYSVLKLLNKKAIRMGTIGYEALDLYSNESLTTPDAFVLHQRFNDVLNRGVQYGVMEISSHALSQCRADDVLFDVVVFTNLTRDHLDYHGTMEDYFLAKRKLFDLLATNEKKTKFAVINCDDEAGQSYRTYCKELNLRVISYGQSLDNDWVIQDFKQDLCGSSFTLKACDDLFVVKTKMIGLHNAYNTVAAIAACYSLGIEVTEVIGAIAEVNSVSGRLEPVGQNGIGVYVDYAHTPDALEHALKSLRGLDPKSLTVVFGCGGDRDGGKRPMMAAIAKEYADKVIVTSDNPRTEDPKKIIEEILSAGTAVDLVEVDRAVAIKKALQKAEKGDVVLIAGKGHEDYQIIGTTKYHFSDQEEVRKFFQSE